MKLVWDETKNAGNRQKHQVSFETAQPVFDDPFHVSRQDRVENGTTLADDRAGAWRSALAGGAHLHRSGRARNHPHRLGAKGRQGGTEDLCGRPLNKQAAS